MRAIVCVFLLAQGFASGDELEDRSAIERVIKALNDESPSAAQSRKLLFTTDAQNELDRLSELDRRSVRSDTPFSEVTSPRIVIQSIRFITPEVALVDAANTQYGSVILVRRVPVLFVLKKSKEWKIASLRVLVDLMDLP